MKPTHERLLELLHYEPSTGDFTRRKDLKGGAKAGDKAGTLSKGYIRIGIDGRIYAAHVLAVFYMTKKWPTFDVDHKDTVRSNNRWMNLRELTRSRNNENQRVAHTNNISGMLGVSRTGRTFFARICVDKRVRYLGGFQTAEAAHEAYLSAKRRLHAANTL